MTGIEDRGHEVIRTALDSCKDVEYLQNLRRYLQNDFVAIFNSNPIKNPPVPSINTLILSSNFYTVCLTAHEIKHCMPLIESYIDLLDNRVEDISQLVAQNPQSPLMSHFAAMVENLRYKSHHWRTALIENSEALEMDRRELRKGKKLRDQAEKQLAESDGVDEDTAEDASEGTSKEAVAGGLQDASH
ncbi:MAG: hypothetical protein Q9221_006739 [Calogaya cf. arnoldii]